MINEIRKQLLGHWLLNIGICLVIVFWLLVISMSCLEAADKTWGGGGDGTNWSDKDNWYPNEIPTANDDLLIDVADGLIIADQTFNAKSITLGGRESTTLTTANFVFGTIEPDNVTDPAITSRLGGKFTLSGLGVITLKGKYQGSRQASTAVSEPSFMLWIE